MKNTYKHLTLEERIEIYRLKSQGVKLTEIARKINRNKGTVSRELIRNKSRCDIPYLPVKAQENSDKKAYLQRRKSPLKNHAVYLYVRQKLRSEKWSPEIIAGRLPKDLPNQHICFETIYQYIHGKGKRHKLWRYLTLRHKKRRVKTGRFVHKDKSSTRIPGAISILKRPDKVMTRKTEGHIETDLMEGVRSEPHVLSVEVFRKTHYTCLTLTPDKKAKTKKKILTKKLKVIESLSRVGKPIVKSITGDNGKENTNCPQVAKTLRVKFYNCQPYHSWEKGTVENTIGRIRYFIPKGTPLSKYSNEQIQWLENKLNNTPRKCLGFMTPNEAMEKEVNSYKFRKFKTQKEAIRCTST